MLAAVPASGEVRSLISAEVAWARACFAAGKALPGRGPRVLRPAIQMFVGGGLAVADAIEAAGYDTLSRRPTVGRCAKLRLAGQAFGAALFGRLGRRA